MSSAPAKQLRRVDPDQAPRASTPTGVSTLNRPPTAGGMSSAGMPSLFAISRSAPFVGSVMNTRCSLHVAHASLQPLAHDQILRHRLRRAARLRRHDEQRAAERDAVEQRRDGIADRRCRARGAAAGRRALILVERVPRRLEQRGAERDRAERRTADAEHDDVVEHAAGLRREVERLVVQRVVGGQREEAELARVATAFEPGVRARETPSAADVQSAAEIPPSTTSPIMFV